MSRLRKTFCLATPMSSWQPKNVKHLMFKHKNCQNLLLFFFLSLHQPFLALRFLNSLLDQMFQVQLLKCLLISLNWRTEKSKTAIRPSVRQMRKQIMCNQESFLLLKCTEHILTWKISGYKGVYHQEASLFSYPERQSALGLLMSFSQI